MNKSRNNRYNVILRNGTHGYNSDAAVRSGSEQLKRYILICFFLILHAVFQVTKVIYAQDEPVYLNTSGVVNRALSVDPTGRTEGFLAVLYNNLNGLPTSEANAIAETSEGFIWIGSYAGLIRYDGNTFERLDSSGGLTSIKCLYVDSKDRLWIGTNDNGVAVMEKGELKVWGKLEGMKSAHTRAITEDDNGTIYIATISGIMMIDADYNLSVIEDDLVIDANMRNLQRGKDGLIYGTTDLGDLMMIQNGRSEEHTSELQSRI